MSRIYVTNPPLTCRAVLTCHPPASQTSVMAQTYFLFDFGPDEEKVQQARHKLESWKQAFRLDKKLQYKLERQETPEFGDAEAQAEPAAKPEKPKSSKANTRSKNKYISDDNFATENGKIILLVR